MKPVKSAFSILMLAAAAFTLIACGQNADSFKSPKENFKVTFEVIEDYKSKGSGDLDDISYVKYKISFFDKEGNYITEGEFKNVYGWSEDAKPRAIDKIFHDFTWSPNEDFVILPEAEEASAPGSPNYKVVNLNPKMKWKYADIRMYIEAWYGDMLLFGNVKDDCHNQVEVFNGETGKTGVVAAAESPVGYEIFDVKGDVLFIRSLLDNCRMEEDEEGFRQKCFEYNIQNGELKENPCR
ncbi:hypothetical protein ACFLR4_03195 [Bacteroidota bacterium]